MTHTLDGEVRRLRFGAPHATGASHQKVLMTHAQARDVLMKYRAFLEHGWDDPANPPKPFEVEYLAEGKEAERRARQAGMDFIEI